MWTAIWATLYFYANHLVGVYHGTENGLKFVAPTFNQDVLLQYWPNFGYDRFRSSYITL